MNKLCFTFIAVLISFLSCQNKGTDNVIVESKKDFGASSPEGKEVSAGTVQISVQELVSLFINNKQDKTEALNHYKKLIRHYEQQNNETAIGELNRAIGNAFCNDFNFDTGLPYLLKSAENFTTAKDYNTLVKVFNYLSLAYHIFGDYNKGIEYANLAIKTFREHPDKVDKNLMWYAYNNLGISYDDNKQHALAIDSHLKALPFATDDSDSSYSYNNLGNTYKKLHQYEKAKSYFSFAYSLFRDYNDVYHLATLYNNLMDTERILKNYSNAEKYIDSAKHYATISNNPDKLIEFYYYTYLLKRETKDYLSAIEYLHEHVRIKDSIFNEEKAKIVYDYQVKHETEKKEKQILETRLISKKKDIWLIALSGSIMAGLIIFIIFRIKTRQRQQQLHMENQLLKELSHSKIQEERLEISRDLHDSLGAQLTFINSILDGLKKNSYRLDESINSKISTLAYLAQNSIAELKNALWVLSSKEIHLQDLKLKLLNFIKNASEAKEDIQFRFNFDVSENLNLHSKLTVNLFRAIQEVVNNSVKHADATEIDVEIIQEGRWIHIQIADNGKGFDYEIEKFKSYGLKNIQNRIADINGAIDIKSIAGEGTAYTIKITL